MQTISIPDKVVRTDPTLKAFAERINIYLNNVLDYVVINLNGRFDGMKFDKTAVIDRFRTHRMYKKNCMSNGPRTDNEKHKDTNQLPTDGNSTSVTWPELLVRIGHIIDNFSPREKRMHRKSKAAMVRMLNL